MSDIDYTQYPLGASPSSEDPRDFPITKLVSQQLNEFPEEFILPYNHEIKNQGNINSCVGHSLTYCREITQEIQDKEYKQFSVGFAYGNRSDTDFQGTGWTPREALNHLLKEGICEFTQFPYNEEYPFIREKLLQNKDNLYKNAYPNRISAYTRLYTLNDIKNALIQLKSPVSFIMKITPSFYQLTKNNPIFNPSSDGKERLYGYHELTCTGFKKLNNEEVLVILNSWGKEWANNGYFYIPTKLLDTQGYYFVEFWSITDEIIPGGEKMETRPCSVTMIDLHHTAGHETSIESIREYHMKEKGYGDIGYNAVIFPDGSIPTLVNSDDVVATGRSIKWSGAHNPGLAPDGSGYTMNQKSYAISHVGNFMEDTMSDVQFNSSVKHCVQKCKEFGITPSRETIRMHKDDYATDCPGDNFPYDRYLNEVVKLFNQGGNIKYMKNIVAYFGDGDRDIALDFANYLGCPLILASQITDELSNAVSGQKYQVGGGSAPYGYKLLAGSDRFATKISILKEMGRI